MIFCIKTTILLENMSLSISNLSHTYSSSALSDRNVLNDISLSLSGGEQLLLRGISGSGKTTLINILAGLLSPSRGSVSLGGQDVYAMAEAERDEWRRKTIGYVFQTHQLLPLLNAWENVAMPLSFAGTPRGESKSRALELLESVGLANHANNRPKELSTGQRQRVAIARALINQPELILADEPTASLDEHAASEALDLLQQNCKERNTVLIVASHDPLLNGRFERVADLAYGELVEKDAVA